MNTKNNAQNHHAVCNVIELHIDSFIAGLKLVGYAAKTLLKKHANLRKFANWRRRLKRPRSEPHEAEVAEFMASSCQPAKADRYLASTALLGFLEHLRHHGVITPFALGGWLVQFIVEQGDDVILHLAFAAWHFWHI